jgi:signal transduction histidine kinase
MSSAPDPRMNRLLAALPDAEWQRLLPRLEPVELALGQVLYEPGQVPLYAYFPATAIVSLLYMTEDGECDEVAVIGREGVVGVSLIMGGRSTPGTAAVQRAGWGFRLLARTVKDEIAQSAAVMHLLLRYSLTLSAQVGQTAVCNRHHTLDQRLCRRLLQGLDRQQDSEILATHIQLAGLLGVRRESITLEVHKLQEAGAVRCSRGHIIVLDRLALERRACQCYAVVESASDRLAPKAAVLPASVDANQPHKYASAQNFGDGIALPRNARLADLATNLQQMREQERGDLARELHDELGALLTCAKLHVASLKSRLSGASADTDQRLQELGEMINRGIAFSRRVVESLHPSSLANLGLTASLEILAREFGKNSGIGIATHLEDADIDVATQLTLYRVVQESLNNASKYAEASDAQIVLVTRGRDIVITVQDNGKGFDTATVEMSSHGLAGMRHRVESCGGQLTVSSEPGKGTLITAVLPKQPVSGAPLHRAARHAPAACVAKPPASAIGDRFMHTH